jgi:hypothetical protein
MAKAAAAAGADGVMVEVHSRPADALSDAAQALLPSELGTLGNALRALARLEGREIPSGPGYRPAQTVGEEGGGACGSADLHQAGLASQS